MHSHIHTHHIKRQLLSILAWIGTRFPRSNLMAEQTNSGASILCSLLVKWTTSIGVMCTHRNWFIGRIVLLFLCYIQRCSCCQNFYSSWLASHSILPVNNASRQLNGPESMNANNACIHDGRTIQWYAQNRLCHMFAYEFLALWTARASTLWSISSCIGCMW